MRRLVAVIVGLVCPSCFADVPPSFDTSSGSTTSSTAASATSTSAVTTGAEPSCADLVCDPNATCLETPEGPACVCDDGFEGDGESCVDEDECTDAPCGVGLCVDLPGGFTCAYPQTCAELAGLLADAADGEYTLFIAAEPRRPWSAYCHDMQGTPREYLTLPTPGDVNTARYVGKDAMMIESRYQRIRLDPATLIVDISDATFVVSTGAATHDGVAVAGVWYGVAMTCDKGTTAANVDLVGTPFTVASEFCSYGTDIKGGVMSPSPQIREVLGGGNCAWYAPGIGGCPYNPIADDPVKPGEGEQLMLAYMP